MPVLRTLLVLLAGTTMAWADAELRTLGGKTIKGNVVAITATEVVQQGEAGQVKTPLRQVLAIDLRPAAKPLGSSAFTLVRLTDDSVLSCSQVKLQGNQAELTLLSGQTAKVPLSAVTWLLKEAQDAKVKARWDELLTVKVKRDRIAILRNGELNPLEGTIGDVDAQGKTVQFRRDTGGTVAVALERIHGMIFFRTDTAAEPPICTVYDTQGDVLSALKVAVEGGNFKVTTPAGVQVTLEERVLARLDYNRGKLTYLVDLEPTKKEERGLGTYVVPVQREQDMEGRKILLAGHEYPKWLSLHAYTALEYDLDGKYKNFNAILGCKPRDDGEDSQAQVTIECDGVKRFSEPVSAKAVRPISLGVRDVRRLRIIVSPRPGPHDFLNLGAYATLAEARVSQ
jgi:hypothetical protein